MGDEAGELPREGAGEPSRAADAADFERAAAGSLGRRFAPPEGRCEICGFSQLDRHCKVVCPHCGFVRDCSDP
ncbi:MAG: hypothetical protein EXS13_06535 [Planctomycetes bacterium]|nr:hypothetical protein [Planctomycetota bacterium]